MSQKISCSFLQIQLKTEDKNLISKFFSPKQVKREPELKQEEKRSPPKSVETNFPDALKKEPKMEEFEGPSLTECKPNLIELPGDSAEKSKVKRDYEKFAAMIESEVHHGSPVMKKKKEKDVEAAGNKQSTLFSYLGKG